MAKGLTFSGKNTSIILTAPNQAEGARQRMEGSHVPHPPRRQAANCVGGKKKNTAGNDSGWQINKLALITIQVSKPSFSPARQLCLSNRFAPAVFIPVLGGWSWVQHPLGGPPRGPRQRVPAVLPCDPHPAVGAPARTEMPLQEPKRCGRTQWQSSAEAPRLRALQPAALWARYGLKRGGFSENPEE